MHFLGKSLWKSKGIDEGCPVIDSFLTKNMDKVPQSLLDFFAEHSANEYYQHIQAVAAKTTSRGVGAHDKTIVSKFSTEIQGFFSQLLTGANPKFIRTINPRPKVSYCAGWPHIPVPAK